MSMDLEIGSGSGVISGPTYLNRSCMMMKMNNAAAAGCGGGGVGVGQPVDARRKQQQQPFDFSKSPGGMSMASSSASAGAAASMGMGFLPFTNAQWKELERQAMVFKYMMHSIPVPYDLLFPFISASNILSDPSGVMRRDTHLLKFLKNEDPEPGRCRRTDGKKWRCSNAVALDQKYCEKHVHRGRPRSRKHVEAAAASDLNKIHKKPCLDQNQKQNQSNISPQVLVSKPISGPQNGACLSLEQLPRSTAGYTNATFQLPSSHVRNGDLFEEQWQQLMQFQQQQQQQQLNLNSYTHPKPDPQEINLFLNPNLKKPASALIDAWTVNGDNISNSHHDLVSLGLSMGHGYTEDADVNESESKHEQIHITNNWLTQSGGPLGEVLRPPLTPSPTTAAGASPPSCTGVLQEAVASLSSSSDPATFPSQPQSGFQWLSQENLLKQSST